MDYANGRLPDSVLAHAANGTAAQRLETQTAKQWAAMVAGAAKDGVTLRPQSDGEVASCYRNFAGQVRAAQIEAAGGPTAATPGFSKHGLGFAIDIDMQPGVFAWLSAHAAEYGFDNVQGKASGEDWHWVRTKFINVSVTAAAVSSTPLTNHPTLEIEDDMKLIADTKGPNATGTEGLVGPGRYFPFGKATGTTTDSAAAVAKVYGGRIDLTHEEYIEVVRASCGDNVNLSKPFPA